MSLQLYSTQLPAVKKEVSITCVVQGLLGIEVLVTHLADMIKQVYVKKTNITPHTLFSLSDVSSYTQKRS